MDIPHPALTDLLDNLIVVDCLADHRKFSTSIRSLAWSLGV